MRQDLRTDRERHRDRLSAAGRAPYPTWSGRTHRAADIRGQYDGLAGSTVTVAGRVRATREHGGIRFLDLGDASGDIQLLCRGEQLTGDDFALLDAVDPGDTLGATGEVTKTRAGEISIDVRAWHSLSKALVPPPDVRAGFKDEEERTRRREHDLLTNESTRRVFALRAQVFTVLRRFLTDEGFTEVETPILQHQPGGAAARPFRTHHQALNLDLTLRVSPEIFLKRLVIGGAEQVFEIGKVFRNEGVDRQHNPEFTACEFYRAYATVEDLLPLTERLLTTILMETGRGLRFTYGGKTVNFEPPWPRVPFVEAVEKATGINVLRERAPATYEVILGKLGVTLPEDRSLPSLMDELITEAVRKKTMGPLLLLDAPVELEPLAKRRPDEPRLVQRFQLIVAGMELIKAYTEENDPGEQEARFRSQAELRGSSELHPLDAEYIEALKVGLPPTAGWGLGVDRLVMIVADQPSIREVLPFPLLRPRAIPRDA